MDIDDPLRWIGDLDRALPTAGIGALVTNRFPLSRFPAVLTTDRHELEQALKTVYGATRLESLEVANGFIAQGTFFTGAELSLGYSTCGSRAVIQFPETDYARLQITMRSSGVVKTHGQTTALRVGQPAITSAQRAATIEYGRDFAQLFLRVQSEALRRQLELLTGVTIRKQVEFSALENSDQGAISFLTKAIRLLVNRLDLDAFGVETTRELQQAIVILFLVTCRHNFSNLLDYEPKYAAPAHARRAADYIEANWHQPVTMEALVAASGVSSRSLFKSFQKFYGTSPMKFVKKLRLQEARRLLVSSDRASVTQIAFACGFSSLGHFARDYYDFFGELPSKTKKS